MKRIANLIVCLILLFTMTGCNDSTKSTNSTQNFSKIDYSGASQFAKEKFSEYMKKLNIREFDIVETSIASRTGNDKHFVCIIEANIASQQGKTKEKLTYGFNIIINNKGEFQVLNQGEDVNNTYLLSGD